MVAPERGFSEQPNSGGNEPRKARDSTEGEASDDGRNHERRETHEGGGRVVLYSNLPRQAGEDRDGKQIQGRPLSSPISVPSVCSVVLSPWITPWSPRFVSFVSFVVPVSFVASVLGHGLESDPGGGSMLYSGGLVPKAGFAGGAWLTSPGRKVGTAGGGVTVVSVRKGGRAWRWSGWTPTWRPIGATSRSSSRPCSGSPASAPSRTTTPTPGAPRSSSATTSRRMGLEAELIDDQGAPDRLRRAARAPRASRRSWSTATTTSSPPSRWSPGSRPRSSRPSATATSTPGAPPTTRGRCSPT